MRNLVAFVMVFMLAVGLLFDQHPAYAWWNTTAVNVYGWAYVPRSGLQIGFPADHVDLYDGWGNWVGSSRCSLTGRWYVNGVRVDGNYRAVAWINTLSGWRSATTWKYVYKPSAIPYDVGFPDLQLPF